MSLDLDRIKARCSLASAAPWSIEVDGSNDLLYVECDHNAKPWNYIQPATDHDRAFINASRTDVPALVREVERLRGLIKDVERCGPTDDESLGLCPWCGVPLDSTCGDHKHRADCPAFTPDGKLK